jgi:aminoglycoside phosphotransferase (APT) family kinase protein
MASDLPIASYVRKAFPHARILAAEPLVGGLINSNFKVQLDSPGEPLVLRIYERDVTACQKETDLLRLIGRTVPVAEVLYAEPQPADSTKPFAIVTFIDGITFRELKHNGNKADLSQAAYSAGQILAAIGQYKFPEAGKLGPGLAITGKYLEGPDLVPRLVEGFLKSSVLQTRTTLEVQKRIHNLIWSWAPRLAELDADSSLVHCDFGSRNLLVKSDSGSWTVAGVIDWEFALSASPLIDVGHFLRYEQSKSPLREPHFSSGFRDGGGILPEGWRALARVLDLTALLDLLTRPQLPTDVQAEMLELVKATVDDNEVSTTSR